MDKQKKIECDQHCGCGETCNNFAGNKKGISEESGQISLRQTWGIDFYSRKNLFHFLPKNLETNQKALIIDDIVRQLNFQGHNGWNILKAAKKILENARKLTKKIENNENITLEYNIWEQFLKKNSTHKLPKKLLLKKMRHGLQTLIKKLNIKQLRELVKSFSKGLGVVCTKPEGISANSLVVQYFGEVYSPWLWYLKQDAIKKFLEQLKKGQCKELSYYKDNFSMEFYNIFLEKHRDEPKGTELVVIDPILQGNYASRLSHSCNPNCVTLPVVSQKKYFIGNFGLFLINVKVFIPKRKLNLEMN